MEASSSSLHIDAFCALDDIGKPETSADWGYYHGVPNPCQNDPIAGIFYLLTCAEEYTIEKKDIHNRIRAKDLSVVKNGYASIPLADRLAEVLAKAVWKKAGLRGSPKMKPEAGYSSLDIDQVYAVRHKPWYKQVSNLGRALLTRNFGASIVVSKAMLGGQDPFDQFAWIQEQHAKRDLRPFIFLLMGYENATDPGWKPRHPQWQSFVDQLSSWSILGLHPSYRASEDSMLLSQEKQHLEVLIDASITRSRQHFLRITWPSTLQSLVQLGIKQDFTLAWPDWIGFRMGTARSCCWFDLSENQQTSLRLSPPSMMEVTGRYYLGLSPKQFLQQAENLTKESKKSNSGLRIIWHNSNLSEIGRWSSWKAIYPKVLDLVSE